MKISAELRRALQASPVVELFLFGSALASPSFGDLDLLFVVEDAAKPRFCEVEAVVEKVIAAQNCIVDPVVLSESEIAELRFHDITATALLWRRDC